MENVVQVIYILVEHGCMYFIDGIARACIGNESGVSFHSLMHKFQLKFER